MRTVEQLDQLALTTPPGQLINVTEQEYTAWCCAENKLTNGKKFRVVGEGEMPDPQATYKAEGEKNLAGLKELLSNPTSPLDVQISGDHYKSLPIQPVEYIHANQIPFIEGCVIKYVTRWKSKGGLKDLEKAKHFIDLLIELETRSSAVPSTTK